MPTDSPPAAASEPTAPRFALGWAALVYAACVLALGYPALGGGFLVNEMSDQLIAGYSFRHFGAEVLRETGDFAQWNPYLFGGMPYIAAMHGDIFYPTFLLRAVLPTDVAMTWGFILHVWLAAMGAFAFLRAWGFGFPAALVGGIAYGFGGNVAGLVSPGHDGKIFVSSLFPFALLLLLRGVRDGRNWVWGVLAIVIGLAVLSPHPQLLQYLLLASGAFALFIAFADTGQGTLPRAVAVRRLGFALGAVVLGALIGAIQYVPVREYVAWSPRAGGKGWEHAVSYALLPSEVLNFLVPQFTGMLDKYWGASGIHLHSEYLGAAVIVLATLAFGGPALVRGQRKWTWFWIGTLIVTLLWALGGATPFYRLVYAIVPGTKYFRAPNTMLYVFSFSVAMLAATGVERAVRGELRRRFVVGWAAGAVFLALLGVSGGLTNLAVGVAGMERADFVLSNAGDLRAGALRSAGFLVLTVGALWLLARRQLSAAVGGWLLAALVAADLWSIERKYWMFSPGAAELFASDATIDAVKKDPQPSRVLAFRGASTGRRDVMLDGDGLMAHDVRQVLGYHGNELGRFQRLGEKDQGWRQIGNPNFWRLMNVRYLLTNAPEPPIADLEKVVGPVRNAAGSDVTLYRLPGENPYAWVTSAMVKAADEDAMGTVLDPRFDVRTVALIDPEATVEAATISSLPAPSTVTASVTSYAPGRVVIELSAPASAGSALVASENYYPGWSASVDGKPAVTVRSDVTLIGVPLPAGARRVELTFDSPAYHTGRTVTLVALTLALLLAGVGAFTSRPARV
jgi:hypothetical protein